MLRIAISGTNWTRKSTVISNLEINDTLETFQIVSLSKLISTCPYPSVVDQTIDTSKWMLKKVLNYIENHQSGNQIFDRSPIDILAFTLYAFERDNKIVDNGLMNEIYGLVTRFNKLYFIRPEGDWAIYEWKDTNRKSFALLMDWYMNRVIKQYGIIVEYLPWDMDQRIEILTEYINQYGR